MSFGDDLRSEFRNESRGIKGKVTEEKLFNSLRKAFSNLSSKSHSKCGMMHGSRSFVQFDEVPSIPFSYMKDRGKVVECELADLLVVTVRNDKLRICCLQNKYEKKKTRGMTCTDKFYADMRQFYLLKQRPVFRRCGIKNNLLRDAICPSVGSYGVFYSCGGNYDMNYHSARVLDTGSKGTGRKRKVGMEYGTSKIRSYTKGYETFDECQYEETIKEFGDSVERMLIGTPLSLQDGLRILGRPFKIVLLEMFEGEDANTTMMQNFNDDEEFGEPMITYRLAVVIKGIKDE